MIHAFQALELFLDAIPESFRGGAGVELEGSDYAAHEEPNRYRLSQR